jgi:S-adenosylmethionine hydrolase
VKSLPLGVLWLALLLASCASAPKRQPLIGLLTDYGTRDSYVAELKGVIYKVAPQARVIDLTHQVPSFDIREGSYLLGRAVKNFPADTVFVAVVDPGVGTARKAAAVQTASGKILVGPDNGLFTRVCDEDGPCVMHELAERRFWRDPETSTTFHGRDIFGPVAGHVAQGTALAELGPRVAEPVRLTSTPARQDKHTIFGEITHVDVYGNCSTNIPASMIRGDGAYEVHSRFFRLKPTYADVPEGEPVLVIDSEGMAELALNRGHLGQEMGWKAGTPLRLVLIK